MSATRLCLSSRGKKKELVVREVLRSIPAVFTFGLRGGYEAGVKLVSNVQLFSHLANIGDTRSLIIHPASTTHRQLTDDQKVSAGAGPDVVRLSIGIEDRPTSSPTSSRRWRVSRLSPLVPAKAGTQAGFPLARE